MFVLALLRFHLLTVLICTWKMYCRLVFLYAPSWTVAILGEWPPESFHMNFSNAGGRLAVCSCWVCRLKMLSKRSEYLTLPSPPAYKVAQQLPEEEEEDYDFCLIMKWVSLEKINPSYLLNGELDLLLIQERQNESSENLRVIILAHRGTWW